MKAAVFQGPPGSWPRRLLSVESVDTPRTGHGEVLVKVAACGICHTDLEYLKEGLRPPKDPPLILGHEISGTIAEVGHGVEGFRVGDRVLVMFMAPCGRCRWCREGRENLCPHSEILGASKDGGLAEYVAAPARSLLSLPDALPLMESAVITDAVATPYHALVNVAGVKPGDSVVIYGATGGLGLSAVQIARSFGASVVAVGRKAWKLELAKELGANHTIATLEPERLVKKVRELTSGGADISLDCSGAPALIEAACKSTRPGGKIVVLSIALDKVPVAINRLTWFEHSISGSRAYRPLDLPRVVQLVAQGKVKLDKLVSHVFCLEQVNDAYAMLDRGEVVRAIVTN